MPDNLWQSLPDQNAWRGSIEMFSDAMEDALSEHSTVLLELSGTVPTDCLVSGRCYPSRTGTCDIVAPIDVTQDDQVEILISCARTVQPWLVIFYDTDSFDIGAGGTCM